MSSSMPLSSLLARNSGVRRAGDAVNGCFCFKFNRRGDIYSELLVLRPCDLVVVPGVCAGEDARTTAGQEAGATFLTLQIQAVTALVCRTLAFSLMMDGHRRVGIEFVDAVGDALLEGFVHLAVTLMQALQVDEIGGGEHYGGNFAALQHALDAAVHFAGTRGFLKVGIDDQGRGSVIRGVPGKRKNSIGGEDGLFQA